VSQATAGGDRPAISIERVTRQFGDVIAVDDISLDIREGEFFSLLGPSGCGKTTTLRMMAGFELPDSGTIRLQGVDVTDTPPNRRNVNLVFQHYELFPHMTVAQNVGYGLRLRRVREPELTERVMAALRLVRAEGLETRGAKQLSGGQQQRVALARAIVNRPAALLLDEPLSALDVKLRQQMQLELKQIQTQLGTTFVYVTHDQEEALLLSDRIGVMDGGRLLQVATPRELYERPATAFVADFVGSLDVIPGRVLDVHDGIALVVPTGTAEVDPPNARIVVRAPDAQPGSVVKVAVRPERVALLSVGAHPRDADIWTTTIPGRVERIIYLGNLTRVVTSTGTGQMVTSEHISDEDLAGVTEGTDIHVTWPLAAGFILPERP